MAYYDGTNDGQYHDAYQASMNPPALIADLTNGNYPNLYQSGNEIGELIPAKPIILDGSSLDNAEVSMFLFRSLPSISSYSWFKPWMESQ